MIQFTHSNIAFYFDWDEYIYDDDADKGIRIYKEMYDWLIENNILYELFWAHKDNMNFGGAIKFNKEEDVMAFKLRWI